MDIFSGKLVDQIWVLQNLKKNFASTMYSFKTFNIFMMGMDTNYLKKFQKYNLHK